MKRFLAAATLAAAALCVAVVVVEDGRASAPARPASTGAATPVRPAAKAAADKAPSWKAADLSQDEIKTRIARADIAETDRLALMTAFKHAAGDAAQLQSVLDKLRMAIASKKKE
ncbi:hypothetical protein [Solirhodobacter olei]|uniref:hypothetical protein n=1 Tax=Solirhodobacter olei TaxID=2493082 RepID=UPI000FD9CBB7|nr:hypothetical protein [Solirhodobacter olei]